MKEDVLPFLGSVVMLAVGWVLSFRLDRSTERVAGSPGTKFPKTSASELAHYVAFWMDRAQAASLLVPPVVGLALGESSSVRWIHVAALGAAIGCVVNVAHRRDPTTYGARQGWSRMSVVLGLSALVNVLGLAAALLTE